MKALERTNSIILRSFQDSSLIEVERNNLRLRCWHKSNKKALVIGAAKLSLRAWLERTRLLLHTLSVFWTAGDC
jgi:hypothetical protein